jgi:hypothetical protein
MSLVESLAMYFKRHEGHWIDGRALATVAGSYAWRSRVAELRKPPFSMPVENRVRTVKDEGKTWRISEYRYRAS